LALVVIVEVARDHAYPFAGTLDAEKSRQFLLGRRPVGNVEGHIAQESLASGYRACEGIVVHRPCVYLRHIFDPFVARLILDRGAVTAPAEAANPGALARYDRISRLCRRQRITIRAHFVARLPGKMPESE
jgi:hypothetical protein